MKMKGDFLMRKYLILIILMICTICLVKVTRDKVIIPDEAIRLRIIPNSNNKTDQNIKGIVKEKIEKEIYNLLNGVTDVKEARTILKNNLEGFEVIIEDELEKEKIDYGYTLNFGYNYFPSKVYKGVTYKEGLYESILITLGKGEGDNWWCVLFPPLCLLEAKEFEDKTDVEYKFFVEELIDKIFGN